MGLECHMCREYKPTPVKVFYQTFPRIAAFAECGWSSNERKDLADFIKRFKISIEPVWKDKKYLLDQPY